MAELDVNDLQHIAWRKRIDELVAQHLSVIELDEVDVRESSDAKVA